MFPRDFWFDVTILIGGASGLYMYLTRSDEQEERPPRHLPVPRPLEPRPRIPPPRPRHLTH